MLYIFIGAGILLLLIILLLIRPKDKGDAGELAVKKALKNLRLSPAYIFNDYYLAPHENASVQIDHIFVCKKGVIVIETKNISGDIYGKEDENEWTFYLAGGKIKHQFYNPVRQNETHVRCLSRAIKNDKAHYISLVVFVQNNTRNISARGVVGLNKLSQYIHALPDVISKGAVKDIADRIAAADASGRISKRKHIRNIRRRHKK